MNYVLSSRVKCHELELPKGLTAAEHNMWKETERYLSSHGGPVGDKLVKVIIIDFDGTICTKAYPSIGRLLPNAKEVINAWYDDGHYVVIDTCRTGKHEEAARVALMEWGIRFDCMNENLQILTELYGSDCRKISGHIRIDDQQVGGLPEWLEIERILDLKWLEGGS